MRKLILIKYAPEIFLKGLNRNKFEKKLRENIKKVISDLEFEFIIDQGRYFLYCEQMEEAIKRIKEVFGVSELCIVHECDHDMDVIGELAVQEVKESGAKTFKIEGNRANKAFPINSLEISRETGAYVLRNVDNISVDVRKPECKVHVEIRERAYVYSKRIKAVGGLPYGMNGSTMLMLSGGIDSPVAGYLMAKRGVEVSCVYYHSHPYTSEQAKEKVIDLARIIARYTGKIKLYVVPFTEIQMSILEKCREDEITIIMRRFMMRVACELSERFGVQSVCTGESIGQVASQTMEGLMVSDDVSDRPVFRPLVTMDKEDIIEIAKKIDTFDTSILPYEDCCTIFVPKHPKTKPRVDAIRKSEAPLEIDALVKDAIDTMEVYDL